MSKKTTALELVPTAHRLTAREQQVVQEIIRLVNEHHDEIEDRITLIGRIILEKCFDNDATRVLAGQTTYPYAALSSRAGQRAFRIDPRLLSLSVRLAAYDRPIDSHRWRALDVGRKEELLPLRDRKLIAAGARQAMDINLNRSQLAQWVLLQREVQGSPVATRRRTFPAFQRRVQDLAERLPPEALTQYAGDVRKLPVSDSVVEAHAVVGVHDAPSVAHAQVVGRVGFHLKTGQAWTLQNRPQR